jgi:hypothetical protein
MKLFDIITQLTMPIYGINRFLVIQLLFMMLKEEKLNHNFCQ